MIERRMIATVTLRDIIPPMLSVDRRWMALLAILVFTSGHDSAAQQPAFSCGRPALTPGRLVRAQAPAPLDTGHASVIGPFVRCTSDLIVLGVYPGQEDTAYTVRIRWIRRLWVRDDARKPGLIAGSVAGAVTFGTVAAFRTNVCYDPATGVSTRCGGPWFRDAVVGAAVGGLVGWVLGSGFPHWRRIFP
jgi:hypothetical protein